MANDSTPNYLYRNKGNGKFTEIGLESGTAPSEDGGEQARMGVAVGDFLHTGYPGLAITVFSDDYTPLFRHDGKWTFEDIGYQSGIGLPSLPWVKWEDAFIDLDNDGWLDLITVTGHVYPQVDTLPSGSNAVYRGPKFAADESAEMVHFATQVTKPGQPYRCRRPRAAWPWAISSTRAIWTSLLKIWRARR